ncbi:unnamed protein product [Kuraishia capsulata CBS 1993]|uniref:Uncharacterized protein n=1 Tax=Kuraishia capsulata CBS 1993 TaxID=1382522 RepID=W6MXN7_9ASCO|nr:uncharacterized protein KUCA_T00005198001 [Kuraishia capsulata CBS 1993]CDK29210.1 unnamed protein product [Kuraishia capsulata CBS 1993]
MIRLFGYRVVSTIGNWPYCTMLRRDPTTIKLSTEDVKEYYRQEAYNMITGTDEQKRANQNFEAASAGTSRDSNKTKDERVLGSR